MQETPTGIEGTAGSTEDAVSQVVAGIEQAPEIDEFGSVVWDKLDRWFETLVALLPNLLAAIVLVVLFWLVSLAVRRLLRRALRPTPITVPVTGLLVTLVGVMINLTGLFVALGILGLDKTVTSLLAGVGILGIALGFAFQDIAANFIAGVILSFRRPAQPGDVVEMDGHTGTVSEINLRSTLLKMPNGETIYIPNKRVFENAIVNYSHDGARRVDVTVGVSYEEDLSEVETLARQAIEGLEQRLPEEPIEVFFEEFGDSSINLVVRFWVKFDRMADSQDARSAAIQAIKLIFDREEISIPFPIRTLDLPSGVGLGSPETR